MQLHSILRLVVASSMQFIHSFIQLHSIPLSRSAALKATEHPDHNQNNPAGSLEGVLLLCHLVAVLCVCVCVRSRGLV